ncbi:MAG: hypothetical protein CMH57_14705 [Myxococcales bacterium]|nr:hypothetical protein [Myxococcales bacterium]
MNEQAMIQGLRRHDPEAMNAFYSAYYNRIFSVARSIVRDEWDAEEVTQDVFWTVYRKIDLFHDNKSLWNWVYRISANAAKMKVRKYKRYPIPLEDQDLQSLSNKGSGANSPNGTLPDQHMAYKEIVGQVNEFLDQSDDLNRKVYMYMDVLGMPKEVAAEKLNLTVSALKSRLHRIRYALRAELGAATGVVASV